MGDYKRSTRECPLEGLGQESVAAVNAHLEKYNLGPILNDYTICVETNSEKIKKGLFAGPGPKVMRMGAVLTPKWLVEITKADNNPIVVRSAMLIHLVVTDFEKSQFYAMLPDTGVQVEGHFTDTTEDSMSFLGLGKDAAGERFKEMILRAVQDAKK